jgi:hypothetical protein
MQARVFLTVLAATAIVAAGCTSVPHGPPLPPGMSLRAALTDTSDSLTRVYTAAQVDKHTTNRPGQPIPRGGWGAPAGRAVARYVVDREGHVEASTITLDSASSPELGRRLLSVLPRWRYYPALRRGRPVRQLTEVEVVKHGHGIAVSLATDVAGRTSLAAP